MRQSASTKNLRSTPKVNQKQDSEKSSEEQLVNKKNVVRKSHEIFKAKPKEATDPLLYLDVNFGGLKGVTWIIMYPDDTPEGIAQRFAKEHKLS